MSVAQSLSAIRPARKNITAVQKDAIHLLAGFLEVEKRARNDISPGSDFIQELRLLNDADTDHPLTSGKRLSVYCYTL
jgi:hypothetical protein